MRRTVTIAQKTLTVVVLAYSLQLTAYSLAPLVWAQSTNGTYTIVQDVVSSGGGSIGSGNPMSAQTILGLPMGGGASNGTFVIIDGMGADHTLYAPPITSAVTISGTVNDASAAVSVNGVAASLTGSTFTATLTLVAGPNTITATATDPLGNAASTSIRIYVDLPAANKTPRFASMIRGTIDDPAATVSVNGVAAAISAGTFAASVPLVNGLNTLTATATDGAGNQTTKAIRVFVPLPTRPPAMPTVGTAGYALPAVTTQASVTIGGTKTKGTSIWINGAQVVAQDDALTWSATQSLVEGDNDVVLVAKDAAGVSSAQVKRNVILDTLPPVIAFAPGQPPAKTNLNPFLLQGSVDDSQTTVTVNTIVASRTARTFDVSLPMVLGSNAVHIIAKSPNGFDAPPKDYVIILGTIPSVQSVTPGDGAKLYLGAPTTFTATATDREQDPIQYRLLLNGAPLGNWGTTGSLPWTPSVGQLGLQQMSIEVKDDFGGSNRKDQDAFVIHAPVQHP